MTITTIQYVKVDQVLTNEALEVFDSDGLPWSFGDCAYSLISQDMLRKWLDDQDDAPWIKEVKKNLDALDRDVLLAL